MANSGTTLFYPTSKKYACQPVAMVESGCVLLYSVCQVMLAASFVNCKSSSSSPQPRYGIHNHSQRPSLANAFPTPGVSTYNRHCDALEDKVENLLRDKKTPINLSYPMDWSIHVGSAATSHVPYDYCSLWNKWTNKQRNSENTACILKAHVCFKTITFNLRILRTACIHYLRN